MGKFDEADLIDEQSRALARRHRHVEQIAVSRQLRKNGLELLAQNFQPRDFRSPQIGEDARLGGAVDSGSAQSGRQTGDALFKIRRSGARRGRQFQSRRLRPPLGGPGADPRRLQRGAAFASGIVHVSHFLPLTKNARVYASFTIDASDDSAKGRAGLSPASPVGSTFPPPSGNDFIKCP